MTKDLNDAKPPVASLITEKGEDTGFPGLMRIGERLARGMTEMIATLGEPHALVSSKPAKLMSFGEWRSAQADYVAICRFRVKPLKGTVLLSLPPQLIVQLVDIFYGGEGHTQFNRAEMTAAEHNFLTRTGEKISDIMSAAWADVATLETSLIATETDTKTVSLVKENDVIAVQTLTIAGGAFKTIDIEWVYPASTLRPIKALANAPEPDALTIIDPVWRNRLADAVMQAKLPLRTIFARTEISLSKLLTLQVGDLIPICLPNRVPITIGGRMFAHATVGDSNGRASIRIEKIEKGSTNND